MDAEQYRARYVRVTNGFDANYVDRFDGVPITIEAHSWQNLPLDVAAHMFGYHDGASPESMFRHTCKRMGWNTLKHLERNPDTGKTLAEEMFAKLVIEPVVYKLVEEKVDTEKPIPADPVPPAVVVAEDAKRRYATKPAAN